MSVAYGQQQQPPAQGAQQSHAPPIPGPNQQQQHRKAIATVRLFDFYFFIFRENVFNYYFNQSSLFQICLEGNRIVVLQPEDHQLQIQLKFKKFSKTILASYNKFKSFKAWAKQTNACPIIKHCTGISCIWLNWPVI